MESGRLYSCIFREDYYNMINVLIVDDHALVRRGIKELVKQIPSVSNVDDVKDGREAIKKISANEYDVILLDIAMPGENGFEVLRQIKRLKSNLSTIILSMYSEENYVYRALKLGASGYLSKDNTPDELSKAIRFVLKGKQYISSDIQTSIYEKSFHNTSASSHELLSNREFQVMTMIASGNTVSSIAKELNISVKTASSHRANLLNKMKMKNNSEIIRYAISEGLTK